MKVLKKGNTSILNGLTENEKNIFIHKSKFLIVEYANNILGRDLILDDNNKDIFKNLLLYFLGEEGEYDLKKGICLTGSYGTGKSSIFRIFHEYLRTNFPFNKNLFRISSIEDIISDSTNDDFLNSVYLFNCKENEVGSKLYNPKNILINEFGHKYDMKVYGTNVNELIDMFLMKRYDIYQQYGRLTHMTTNFDAKQLNGLFHPKIYDRFKEMINIIPLNGKSHRK